MMSEKVKGFKRYEPNSYHVKSGERLRLVKTIFSLGKKLDQSGLTLHLTVRLLDRLFSLLGGSINDIATDSYDLIMNGCMILAAKYEELDMKIP
jgi:Cyclin, N-terminal domain